MAEGINNTTGGFINTYVDSVTVPANVSTNLASQHLSEGVYVIQGVFSIQDSDVRYIISIVGANDIAGSFYDSMGWINASICGVAVINEPTDIRLKAYLSKAETLRSISIRSVKIA